MVVLQKLATIVTIKPAGVGGACGTGAHFFPDPLGPAPPPPRLRGFKQWCVWLAFRNAGVHDAAFVA